MQRHTEEISFIGTKSCRHCNGKGDYKVYAKIAECQICKKKTVQHSNEFHYVFPLCRWNCQECGSTLA